MSEKLSTAKFEMPEMDSGEGIADTPKEIKELNDDLDAFKIDYIETPLEINASRSDQEVDAETRKKMDRVQARKVATLGSFSRALGSIFQ